MVLGGMGGGEMRRMSEEWGRGKMRVGEVVMEEGR